MTVCIGALCENGASVVVAADKMVTFGAPVNLQVEPPTLRKIFPIGPTCLVLFSGSGPDGEELIAHVRSQVGAAENLPVPQIAEIAKGAYIALKQKRVEETILRPILGATMGQYQALLAQAAASQMLAQVMGLMMQHNLGFEVLVAGTDATGGHLFAVTHPGQLLPVSLVGYAAVGSGALHSSIRMSLGQHNKGNSLSEAVFNVYEAKRAAEVAPGVGKLTDMAIVKDGKITDVKPELLKALDHAHKERPAPTEAEMKKIEEALK